MQGRKCSWPSTHLYSFTYSEINPTVCSTLKTGMINILSLELTFMCVKCPYIVKFANTGGSQTLDILYTLQALLSETLGLNPNPLAFKHIEHYVGSERSAAASLCTALV